MGHVDERTGPKRGDSEPGRGEGDGEEESHSLFAYTLGLSLAIMLTEASFYTAGTTLI